MGYPKCELRVFRKLDDVSWATTYTAYDIASLSEKESLDVSRDNFSIKLENVKNVYTNAFAVDDKMEIYMYRTETPEPTDIIIDGSITEIGYDTSEEGRMISIKGSNRTQELLGSLVLIKFTNNSKTVREIITEIVSEVNNNNQAQSTSHPRHIFYDDTTIVTTKSDGNPFTTKSFIATYKTAYEAIANFSGNEFTDDGEYIFWIDSANYLHWTYKTFQVQEGYNFTEGLNVEEMSIDWGTWGVYNSVIVDVGRDCYNHGNHALQLNPQSIIEAGAKWKLLNREGITPNILNNEFAADITKWDYETAGGAPTRKYNFPLGASYPYTCLFKEINTSWVEQTNSWVVSNDAEFNNAIRKEARFLGKKEGKDYLISHGSLKYKAQITLNGTLAFEKALIASVTSANAGITNLPLRIMAVNHNFSKSGWITRLDLEEDDEEA